MGNTCIPVADSCWHLAKPIQYCKVKKKKIKKNTITIIGTTYCVLDTLFNCPNINVNTREKINMFREIIGEQIDINTGDKIRIIKNGNSNIKKWINKR